MTTVTTCPDCGLSDALSRDQLTHVQTCESCGWYDGKPKVERKRLEHVAGSWAAQNGQCAASAMSDSLCDLQPHGDETPHRMRSPYDARWIATDAYGVELGRGGGREEGTWPSVSWTDWLAKHLGLVKNPPPAGTCDPVIWYANTDDGIHLVCDVHGDNLIGFSPTLAELTAARDQHCGTAA